MRRYVEFERNNNLPRLEVRVAPLFTLIDQFGGQRPTEGFFTISPLSEDFRAGLVLERFAPISSENPCWPPGNSVVNKPI